MNNKTRTKEGKAIIIKSNRHVLNMLTGVFIIFGVTLFISLVFVHKSKKLSMNEYQEALDRKNRINMHVENFSMLLDARLIQEANCNPGYEESIIFAMKVNREELQKVMNYDII